MARKKKTGGWDAAKDDNELDDLDKEGSDNPDDESLLEEADEEETEEG